MKLFFTGLAVGFLLMACLHHMSPPPAQAGSLMESMAAKNNKYMIAGDKYQKQADECVIAEVKQAYAIQALAAYTAATTDMKYF